MSRSKLIATLDEYARRFPFEAAIAQRFRDFIARHTHCFERWCQPGHVTASAWILHPDEARVLLTHHKKLGRWLQPGGHSDGQPDPLAVALREAREESGLEAAPYSPTPIDIDIHEIPAYGTEPAHRHYDLRYALAAKSEAFSLSEESRALAWVAIDALETYTREASILRLRSKWLSMSGGTARAKENAGG